MLSLAIHLLASLIRVPGFSPDLWLPLQPPAKEHFERKQVLTQVVAVQEPTWRPGLHSKFLGAASFTLSCCGHLGSEAVD